MEMSGLVFPDKYDNIATKVLKDQLCCLSSPLVSLDSSGFPTGFETALAVEKLSCSRILSIRNGCVKEIFPSASVVNLTPKYLLIGPSSVKSNSDCSDEIKSSTSCFLRQKTRQSLTYTSTTDPSFK